jgi:hypothetical protein
VRKVTVSGYRISIWRSRSTRNLLAPLAKRGNRSNGGHSRASVQARNRGSLELEPSRALPKAIGERSGSSKLKGLGARTVSLWSCRRADRPRGEPLARDHPAEAGTRHRQGQKGDRGIAPPFRTLRPLETRVAAQNFSCAQICWLAGLSGFRLVESLICVASGV